MKFRFRNRRVSTRGSVPEIVVESVSPRSAFCSPATSKSKHLLSWSKMAGSAAFSILTEMCCWRFLQVTVAVAACDVAAKGTQLTR